MGDLIERAKKTLFEQLGLEGEELNEFIQMAKSSLTENFTELDKAFTEGDIETLARRAHTIKGVLLNLGLEEEAAFAKEIELEAKGGADKEKLGKMIEKLKETIGEFLLS
jgi:HPt (histidine-containing phosphotransfer) domain-containing protein